MSTHNTWKDREAWAYAQRGETYRLAGEYRRALVAFDNAITLEPDYTWAYAHRGATYRLMECYDEALADLKRAIELDSDYVWAYAQRGETYRLMVIRYQDKRFIQNAVCNFDQAINLSSKKDNSSVYAWAYAHRGASYRLRIDPIPNPNPPPTPKTEPQENHDETVTETKASVLALNDFDKAIELNRTYAWAWGMRNVVYKLNEDYEKAWDNLMVAILLEPTLFEEEELQRSGSCLTLYGKSSRHHECGMVSLYCQEFERAITSAEQALNYNPNDAFAQYIMAVAMICWKGVNKAQADIDKARTLLQQATISIFSDLANWEALEHKTTHSVFSKCFQKLISLSQSSKSFISVLSEITTKEPLVLNVRECSPQYRKLSALLKESCCAILLSLGGLEIFEGNTEQALKSLRMVMPFDSQYSKERVTYDLAWRKLHGNPDFQSLVNP